MLPFISNICSILYFIVHVCPWRYFPNSLCTVLHVLQENALLWVNIIVCVQAHDREWRWHFSKPLQSLKTLNGAGFYFFACNKTLNQKVAHWGKDVPKIVKLIRLTLDSLEFILQNSKKKIRLRRWQFDGNNETFWSACCHLVVEYFHYNLEKVPFVISKVSDFCENQTVEPIFGPVGTWHPASLLISKFRAVLTHWDHTETWLLRPFLKVVWATLKDHLHSSQLC